MVHSVVLVVEEVAVYNWLVSRHEVSCNSSTSSLILNIFMSYGITPGSLSNAAYYNNKIVIIIIINNDDDNNNNTFVFSFILK